MLHNKRRIGKRSMARHHILIVAMMVLVQSRLASAEVPTRKMKVFVLAGQSNMVGWGDSLKLSAHQWRQGTADPRAGPGERHAARLDERADLNRRLQQHILGGHGDRLSFLAVLSRMMIASAIPSNRSLASSFRRFPRAVVCDWQVMCRVSFNRS